MNRSSGLFLLTGPFSLTRSGPFYPTQEWPFSPDPNNVRKTYPEHVRKYLWGDAPFWSSSYFTASTGTTSLEKVKEYIEGQRTEEHSRKYVKSGKYKKKKP